MIPDRLKGRFDSLYAAAILYFDQSLLQFVGEAYLCESREAEC